MSYIALARQWRPQTFHDLVGQDHVVTALINSIERQRLHHAYLFTGTRGVGKTSIARLFAKALNCEAGMSATPCLTCDTCQAILEGSYIDLIEIDGASKTRVEDTRDLLDNVQYAPTLGRFKIYLIDEVHMLSNHSFNALLKTLEEPPAHVKFLLATTDPQKLPVTVLSRCIQFHLRPFAPTLIHQQLAKILQHEHVPFEDDGLKLLAEAASGSMRDALSLLDLSLAISPENVSCQNIRQMLGYTSRDYAADILQALTQKKPEALLSISQQISEQGGQFRYVLEEFASFCHKKSIEALEASPHTPTFSPEDLQLFYQIAVKGANELSLAPSNQIGFEMTLLRLYAFMPAPLAKPPRLQSDAPSSSAPEAPIKSAPQASTASPDVKAALTAPPKSVSQPTTHHTDESKIELSTFSNKDWPMLIARLKLGGLAFNALQNTMWDGIQNQRILLKVSPGHGALFTPSTKRRIEEAFIQHFANIIGLDLVIEQEINASPAMIEKQQKQSQIEDAAEALTKDPFFQKLQQDFDAEIVKNSITPVKDGL